MEECNMTSSGKHDWDQIYNSDFEKPGTKTYGIRFYMCKNCGFKDDTDKFSKERK